MRRARGWRNVYFDNYGNAWNDKREDWKSSNARQRDRNIRDVARHAILHIKLRLGGFTAVTHYSRARKWSAQFSLQ